MIFRGILFLVAVYLCVEICLCANILIVPVPIPTHVEEAISLGLALKQNGSMPFIVIPAKYPRRHQFRHLGLGSIVYDMSDEELVMGTTEYHRHITSKALEPGITDEDLQKLESRIIGYHCLYMMQDEKFLDTVSKTNIEFAVVDGYAWNPCMAGLAAHMKIPFAVWSSTLHPYHVKVRFEAEVPAFGARMARNLGSLERFWNMWLYMTSDITHYHDDYLLERFPPPPLQSWATLLRRARVFIATVDETLAWSSQSLKGYLRVPGLNTGNPKELKGSLAEIVSSKSTGSDIIMSFGLFSRLPDDIMVKILRALASTHKLVLTDLDPPAKKIERPDNIHFVRSLPMNDVLGHKTFQILISVCDNDVVYQALYHGVSVLCFPMMGEQHHTAFRVTDRQLGLSLDIRSFTELELFQALSSLLRPSSQTKENCRRVSRILQKRKNTPAADVATEITAAVELGFKYKRAPAGRSLWRVFIVEMVLLFAALVASIKLFFWCRAIEAVEEKEEYSRKKESKKTK